MINRETTISADIRPGLREAPTPSPEGYALPPACALP